MNSIFRIASRNFSQLPKVPLHGCDPRLNFLIQELSNHNLNHEPARAFHVTAENFKKTKKFTRYEKILYLDPTRDRSKKISVETSIKYLQSEAFKKGYGDDPVWTLYRRNHKGLFPPRRTRKTCIRNDVVVTGNPCPICRDEYLVVDYRNIELLKQFISPYNGEVISYEKTGVCQRQHEKILIAYLQARDLGLITFDVPFRKYDYAEYELK